MNKRTCYLKDGATAYTTQMEALKEAALASKENGVYISVYPCGACNHWHLSTADIQTPSRLCSCKGRDGKLKFLYETYEDAKRRANNIYQERNIQLDVYKCYLTNGFHLTKG